VRPKAEFLRATARSAKRGFYSCRNSVCPSVLASVCLSVTTRYRFKPM